MAGHVVRWSGGEGTAVPLGRLSRPDLRELQLESGKIKTSLQNRESVESLGIAACEPNLSPERRRG